MARGFEIVSKYGNQNINVPARQTKNAAGYDFEATADFKLPSIWKLNFLKILKSIRQNEPLTDDDYSMANSDLKPLLVPTGIKAFMEPNEVLILVNRSSGPLKRHLILPNGIGVIDADYYNNDANEGEIFVQLINFGVRDYVIKKGERIAQGIFMPYLTATNEVHATKKRVGGFGSTQQ